MFCQAGVGNSTWTNALVNYLRFSILEEVINSEGLERLIPRSFSVSRVNDHGKHVSLDIKVGFGTTNQDTKADRSRLIQSEVMAIEEN